MANSNLDDSVPNNSVNNPNSFAYKYKNDPAFRDQYNNHMAQNWSDIQNKTNGYQEYGGGGFFDKMDNVMEPIMNTAIAATPYLLAGSLGAAAGGLFAGAGEGAGAAAGGAEAGGSAGGGTLGGGGLGDLSFEGLGGNLSTDLGSSGGYGWLGGAGTGAGEGLGAIAGGSASTAGTDGAMQQVVIHGTPSPATSGFPWGPATPLATGTIPYLSNINQSSPTNGVPFPSSGFGNVALPPLTPIPSSATDPVAAGQNIPGGNFTPTPTGYTPGGSTVPSFPGSGTGGTPSPLGGLLGGLGSLYGAYSATKNTAADTDYYKSLLDKMMGMYQPGTPEATLMENKMNAQDAAAGRRSQYGIRADNLAAQLAQQRASIMTSPTFAHIADRYRDKYDDKDNGLLSLFGNNGQTGAGAISGIVNGLGSLFGSNSNSTPMAPAR